MQGGRGGRGRGVVAFFGCITVCPYLVVSCFFYSSSWSQRRVVRFPFPGDLFMDCLRNRSHGNPTANRDY